MDFLDGFLHDDFFFSVTFTNEHVQNAQKAQKAQNTKNKITFWDFKSTLFQPISTW